MNLSPSQEIAARLDLVALIAEARRRLDAMDAKAEWVEGPLPAEDATNDELAFMVSLLCLIIAEPLDFDFDRIARLAAPSDDELIGFVPRSLSGPLFDPADRAAFIDEDGAE